MSIFDRFRQSGAGNEQASASQEQDGNDGDVEAVEGERGVSAVQRPPSLQSRLSNFLALGLMGALGIGLLVWYYAHSLENRASARMAAQSSAKDKAKGDVALRPLRRVDPPVVAAPSPQESTLQEILGEPPNEPPPPDIPEAWLRPAEEPSHS